MSNSLLAIVLHIAISFLFKLAFQPLCIATSTYTESLCYAKHIRVRYNHTRMVQKIVPYAYGTQQRQVENLHKRAVLLYTVLLNSSLMTSIPVSQCS